MAAMVVVIGLGMGSCVDNIDNSTTPSEKEQQAEEARQAKAQKFWAVASQLVDLDDYTEDYEGKTFESTYGVEGAEAGTRYVFTNDLATAAARFADLVEQKGIDENTETYTYDDPDVGTLVYTKGSGRILATVDVSIKQIPSLKKIVYVPGAYANGSFRGRAYYRFGDVVSREVNGYGGEKVIEYWICVRPSFGPESKGDSHWVCLNVLAEKNVWHYYSKNSKKNYYLPTGIGTNEEHMQNLAEMLYAIYFPNAWQENVSDIANTDLKMFHDFNKTRYPLHNNYFWMDVRQQWGEKEILKKALNFTEEGNEFKNMLRSDGIRLLHSGYSWWTTTSWNATLYEAHYQNGMDSKEKNMHKVSFDERTNNMQIYSTDCRKMGKDNYDNYKAFFNNDGKYRWTIRHATGKDLAARGTAYNKQGKIQGVVELYRYYRDVVPTADDAYVTTEPEEASAEVAKDKVAVGYLIDEDGKFYKSYDAILKKAVAMVVYLGRDKRVEKDKDWNALAIALKDVSKDYTTDYDLIFGESGQDNTSCSTTIADEKDIASRLDGWAMTQRLKNHECNANHSHPGAENVGALEQIPGCSEWFIPSAGQWDLAMQGMCYGKYTELNEEWGYAQEGQWLWEEAGVAFAELLSSYDYMTITMYDNDDEYLMFNYFSDWKAIGFSNTPCDSPSLVRPFLAFKVGAGGNK
jgi:hypothetical protein